MKELFKNIALWKMSLKGAFSILAILETIMSICLFSLEKIDKWWNRAIIILIVYVVFTIVIYLISWTKNRYNITIDVRGIPVTITTGDLFDFNGWKLISFTERYDLQVDDIVINKNSINGQFIRQCESKGKADELKKCILDSADEAHTRYKRKSVKNTWYYPLGRIKIFEDYMLMSFTRFNEDYEAHLTRAEYEQCLRVMWTEISRTYANKPIAIPLLGGGITRFDDWDQKSNFDLLKCMLCTLKSTNIHINQPITILLTKKDIEKVNLYELKGNFK